MTVYPSIRQGDVEETLLHELVHLHVGVEPGRRRWHGQRFKRTLQRAMAEAYGVTLVQPPNACHGVYAAELERVRTERATTNAGGDQLELPIAA